MVDCIFCPTALTPDTTPEHVWLNALGGRATTQGVICSDCNNTFGSTIDAAIARQVRGLRTLLNLPSGDQKAPPPLHVAIEENQKFVLSPDGRIASRKKPFTINKRDDGSFDITIAANDLEHVNNLIPHIAAAVGISEESLRTQLPRANAREITQPSPHIKQKTEFGGHDALRSLAKSCLVLWNKNGQDNAINESSFEAIKTFIVSGNEAFLSGAIRLDGRQIPGAETLVSEFGPIFNLLFIKSDCNGKVLAYVGMYNTVYWRIVVAQSGATPNHTIGLVSDPVNPNKWSYIPNFEFDLDMAWLEAPVTAESSRSPLVAIDAAFKNHMENQQKQHIHKILLDTLRECGIAEGDLFTKEAMAIFSERLAYWFLRIPTDRPLSDEELNKFAHAAKASDPIPT